jgi:2-polyprenyl-3-methyl-5-hydroxy-6-metoxy-1,4-benzoquinol methylase
VYDLTCPLCESMDISHCGDYNIEWLNCRSIKSCNNCDLYFAHEFPGVNELNNYYSNGLYYDKVADPFHEDIIEFSKNLALVRLSLIEKTTDILNKKCKTIDIGAGNASFGTALKVISNDATYAAVEPDTKVRENYGDWVDFQYNNIAEIEEDDYDLVVMNQILEHLPDPVEFLQSVCKLLKEQGYLYIDVPYKDYLFKPSVEPHLLFWSPKSMSFLIEKMDMKLIFCDTVGMPHEQAKRFFHQSKLLEKIRNPWLYANKINKSLKKIGFPPIFDTFSQFQADEYGGDRQWLRCIAQKID